MTLIYKEGGKLLLGVDVFVDGTVVTVKEFFVSAALPFKPMLSITAIDASDWPERPVTAASGIGRPARRGIPTATQ
ncbi:MAG: hypothetical protein ACYC0X_29460 [Pirellulaceae bacterium]